MPMDDLALRALAQKLRRDTLLMTAEAGSGHPTSCMSSAELVAVLFGREMAFDPRDAERAGTDQFVLSKGHAAPLLWAVLKAVGAIDLDVMTLRRIDSPLEGHPTPRIRGWVKVATGSLGQGLAAAVGMGLARRLVGDPGRVYCLMGDGEVAEGSVWEAAALAAHERLSSVCAIVDANGQGQSGRTMHHDDIEALMRKWRAFGWHAVGIDGHDVVAIARAFEEVRRINDRPAVIVARTLKGKGAKLTEDKDNWHGKPLKKGAELNAALADVGDPDVAVRVEARTRGPAASARPTAPVQGLEAPPYRPGDEIATREAYGDTLARLGAADGRIVVLDGDVKNSTFSERFKARFPERFVECFIQEQAMIGAALGFAAEGLVPCASSFAAFLTRAYDFVRMGVYSQPRYLIVAGSHVGVSIGEDGPSQMGLEDLAMMRALLGTTVLYPADGVATARLLEESIRVGGIVYLRLSRPKTRVLYGPEERFPIGGLKVLRRSPRDVATVVAAGVTLYEALTAYERLAADGVYIRVVDLYCVKPLDAVGLRACADETGAMITVEDHAAWGGLGEAVAAQVRCPRWEHLAVRELPRSGKPAELMARHGLDADAIVRTVRKLAGR